MASNSIYNELFSHIIKLLAVLQVCRRWGPLWRRGTHAVPSALCKTARLQALHAFPSNCFHYILFCFLTQCSLSTQSRRKTDSEIYRRPTNWPPDRCDGHSDGKNCQWLIHSNHHWLDAIDLTSNLLVSRIRWQFETDFRSHWQTDSQL